MRLLVVIAAIVAFLAAAIFGGWYLTRQHATLRKELVLAEKNLTRTERELAGGRAQLKTAEEKAEALETQQLDRVYPTFLLA